MKLSIFTSIVLDEKANLSACIANEDVANDLSLREILHIVPAIKDIMDCENLLELELITGWTEEYLERYYEFEKEDFENWKTIGFSYFEKFTLAFLFASSELELLRYHTCQVCFADFYSKDPTAEVCPKCHADFYKYMTGSSDVL